MSRCYVHPEMDAVTRCTRCGKEICVSCAVDYFGKLICIECGKPLLNWYGGIICEEPHYLLDKKAEK